jgi:hypothetical protein
VAMHDPTNEAAYLEHYAKCLRNGCDPKLAEALARRVAPGIRTDSTHFAGRMGRQFADQPERGDYYAAELRARGDSPAGKVYISGLARYAGDPEAWVSSRGEIADVCKRRGWGVSGDVNVKSDQYADPTPEIPLDPQIVTDEIELKLAKNPEIAPTPKEKERLWNETYEQRLPPKHRDKRMLGQVLAEEGLA